MPGSPHTDTSGGLGDDDTVNDDDDDDTVKNSVAMTAAAGIIAHRIPTIHTASSLHSWMQGPLLGRGSDCQKR
jgi:hypothetical protein